MPKIVSAFYSTYLKLDILAFSFSLVSLLSKLLRDKDREKILTNFSLKFRPAIFRF